MGGRAVNNLSERADGPKNAGGDHHEGLRGKSVNQQIATSRQGTHWPGANVANIFKRAVRQPRAVHFRRRGGGNSPVRTGLGGNGQGLRQKTKKKKNFSFFGAGKKKGKRAPPYKSSWLKMGYLQRNSTRDIETTNVRGKLRGEKRGGGRAGGHGTGDGVGGTKRGHQGVRLGGPRGAWPEATNLGCPRCPHCKALRGSPLMG